MMYIVLNRETIASLATAVGFTSTYIPPTDLKCFFALIQAVGGDVRFCIDGTTPTTSKGMRLTEDSTVEIWDTKPLIKFLAIDDGGTATLEVVYFGRG